MFDAYPTDSNSVQEVAALAVSFSRTPAPSLEENAASAMMQSSKQSKACLTRLVIEQRQWDTNRPSKLWRLTELMICNRTAKTCFRIRILISFDEKVVETMPLNEGQLIFQVVEFADNHYVWRWPLCSSGLDKRNTCRYHDTCAPWHTSQSND